MSGNFSSLELNLIKIFGHFYHTDCGIHRQKLHALPGHACKRWSSMGLTSVEDQKLEFFKEAPNNIFIRIMKNPETHYVVKLCHYFSSPGSCILKLITAVIYGFRNKLECLSLNTRLGWKGLPGTNTLAYYRNRKLRL